MLRKRVMSSALLITFVIITIFAFPIRWFAIIAALFIGLSLYELFVLFNNKGININKPLGISLGMAMSPVAYFGVQDSFFIVLVLVALFLFQLTRKSNSEAVYNVSATFFGVIYVGWLFSFLVKLRLLEGGIGVVSYLLLVTKSGDIGAYIIGRNFGKHKLIPRLSPNKTVEGFIGAVVISLLIAVICYPLLSFTFYAPHFILLGIVLGLLSQLGDLIESLIKRDCKVKDAGRLVPGLGGMLDIIDSLLFTAPVFYFYVKLVR